MRTGGERCYPRVLRDQSTTCHSPRPRQAPDSLPRRRLPAAEAVCIRNASSLPHYLLAASRRSMLHRQAPNVKNVIGREEYIDTWHEDLTQVLAIFLERPSADLPSEYLSLHWLLPACTTQLFSRLLNALRCAPPQFPNIPTLTAQLSQYATSHVRSGFNIRTLIPPLFEDAVRVRASGELCWAAKEFGRAPEIGWTAVRVAQADPRGLQGRRLALYVHTGAGRRVHPPIAILVNAIVAELNGLRLLALRI
jgi:hypothetical protein